MTRQQLQPNLHRQISIHEEGEDSINRI